MNSYFTRGTENLFTPDEDVFERTEDGREILVARAGTPISMEKADKAGLLKTKEKAEEKADKVGLLKTEKKADKPSENK